MTFEKGVALFFLIVALVIFALGIVAHWAEWGPHWERVLLVVAAMASISAALGAQDK